MKTIHYDISDSAWWRALCDAKPNAKGTNLSVADNQVTCRKCLKALGYE